MTSESAAKESSSHLCPFCGVDTEAERAAQAEQQQARWEETGSAPFGTSFHTCPEGNAFFQETRSEANRILETTRARKPQTPPRQTYSELAEGSGQFLACSNCGAVVVEETRDIHDDFHNRISKTAEDASQASFWHTLR